jgi:hypothetical protein
VLSRRRLLLGLVTVPLTLAGCRREQKREPQVVDLFIESDGDFLAYHPDTLTCPSGAVVRLTFHHGGKFLSARHNWVLVYPGQMEAVDKDVDDKEGIISKDDKRVIADTPMCDKGDDRDDAIHGACGRGLSIFLFHPGSRGMYERDPACNGVRLMGRLKAAPTYGKEII